MRRSWTRSSALWKSEPGFIEAELAKDGRTPDQSDLAEMDGLWNKAKNAERS